eukprot:833131-Prymnesium_polylepis.1
MEPSQPPRHQAEIIDVQWRCERKRLQRVPIAMSIAVEVPCTCHIGVGLKVTVLGEGAGCMVEGGGWRVHGAGCSR